MFLFVMVQMDFDEDNYQVEIIVDYFRLLKVLLSHSLLWSYRFCLHNLIFV